MLELDGIKGWILHWDPDILAALAKRGARFPDFPAQLDTYISTMHTRSLAQVATDYRKFKLFYFDHLKDEAREQPFRRRLAAR
jgi:hypothetical protein